MNEVNLSTQVVLLAGGLGTRIKEETVNRPKPMIEIGGRPILWHLMKNFSTFGVRRFIVCAGYKSEVIVDYFSNFLLRSRNFTVNLNEPNTLKIHDHNFSENWEVTVVHTGGPDVGTGGRVLKSKPYIDNFPFICTYGDGLSDVDVSKLLYSHKTANLDATVTVINQASRYGIVEFNDEKAVTSFKEKPASNDWINAGYFCFQESIFDKLDSRCMLENEPLKELVLEGRLNSFQHLGFWQAMDTYREYELLTRMWEENRAPWVNWSS